VFCVLLRVVSQGKSFKINKINISTSRYWGQNVLEQVGVLGTELFRNLVGEVLGQYLESDFSVQAAVFSQVDFAHSASSRLFDDFVMADGCADH